MADGSSPSAPPRPPALLLILLLLFVLLRIVWSCFHLESRRPDDARSHVRVLSAPPKFPPQLRPSWPCLACQPQHRLLGSVWERLLVGSPPPHGCMCSCMCVRGSYLFIPQTMYVWVLIRIINFKTHFTFQQS